MVRVESPSGQLPGRAAAPTGGDRLVDLGVELGCQRPAHREYLGTDCATGEFGRSGRHGDHVVVPLHPWPRRDLRFIGLDVVPADLADLVAPHRPAERVGDHLGSEADSEHRDARLVSRPYERGLGGDVGRHIGPEHRPIRTEQNDQFVAGQTRPLVGMLPVTLAERIPVITKSVADQPRVGIVGVGNQQGTHESQVTTQPVGRALVSAFEFGRGERNFERVRHLFAGFDEFGHSLRTCTPTFTICSAASTELSPVARRSTLA